MKKLIFIFAILIGTMVAIHISLQNGSFLRYLDEHPDPRWVPAVEYGVGETYYLFQDLDEAATYFIRVPQTYPNSSQADDAYWGYLESLDDMTNTTRTQLIDEYRQYLQQFPNGAHAAAAQSKIDAYVSGNR